MIRAARKKNRRRGPGPWRRGLRVAWRSFVVLALFAAALAACLRARGWVVDHPYFALREIRVEVDGRVNAAQVVEWAGLSEGMSTWRVDEREVARRLLSEPRLKSARVVRLLPGQVRLFVEERKPVGVVLAGEPRFFAADGTAYSPLAGERVAGWACVTGLRARDVAAGSGAATERLRLAARVIDRWQAHPEWPRLSELHPAGGDLVAFVARTPLSVRFSGDVPDGELDRLGTVLGLWQGREAEIAAIDVSLPDQAILRLRRGAGRRTAT